MPIHLSLPEDDPVSMPDLAASLLGMPPKPRRPRAVTREEYLRDINSRCWLQLAAVDCLNPTDLMEQLRPLGPLAALSAVNRVRRKLRRALECERRRGKAALWFYDINKHMALAYALRRETALAKQLTMCAWVQRGRG